MATALPKLAAGWKESASLGASARALRLSLLRDWSRHVHADTSRLLARGEGGSAKDNQRRETWIDSLLQKDWMTQSWEQLNELPDLPALPASAPPAGLAGTPAELREKLERRDRFWEREIWLAGLRAGWKTYELLAKIPVRAVETWNDALGRELWPRGVSLFTEAGDPPVEGDNWNGRWYAIVDPALFGEVPTWVVNGIPATVKRV